MRWSLERREGRLNREPSRADYSLDSSWSASVSLAFCCAGPQHPHSHVQPPPQPQPHVSTFASGSSRRLSPISSAAIEAHLPCATSIEQHRAGKSSPLPASELAAIQCVFVRIRELARRAELPARTVRYYADLGLLGAAARTTGGYREFDEHALRQLRFIRRAQAVGMSLKDVVSLLRAAERLSCGQSSRLVTQRLTKQLEFVERRIAQLEGVQHELSSLLSRQSSGCADELCLCNARVERRDPLSAGRRH